jgi:plasmid stabilization system protein ParE
LSLEYSAAALGDLEQIERYYAERTTAEFARQSVERITATFERLVMRNPRAGRLRKDLDPDARLLPVLAYLVFYRVEERRVQVRRILHGHRNLKPPLASLLAV